MGSRKLSRGGFVSWREAGTRPTSTMPSSLNYSWNVRGTFNGDFIGASGTTASVDGVAEVHGTAGEGAPFSHSSCFLWWDGNKDKGTWVVRSWPQYAVAVPKGNDHVWYRAAFQWELNDGSYY